MEVKVFVGTRKGGFIFTSDQDRKNWQSSDLLFKSWEVMHMNLDSRDKRLYAAASHFVYGPTIHYSDDLGKTWTQAKEQPGFTRPSKSGKPYGTAEEAFRTNFAQPNPDQSQEKVIKIWNIQPGRDSEPDVLYAGVQPAALFKSADRGETWTLNEDLYDHPHRGSWNPGAGGLCMHTVLPDPTDPNRMYVAVSSAGVYRTEDGGRTWSPQNKNVRADYNPDPYPEYGQCVHKLALHPSKPERLYQQNHCGMYRSDNHGSDWIDIGDGKIPSRFGFPIVIHPHDPETIYVIPEESDEYRVSLGGQVAVWRSRNAGESWERLTNGLPDKAHVVILREAAASDSLDPAGIYFGTDTGQLFYSRDNGDSWQMLADFLPPILSVEAAVV
jgi:photosystem II stability/assembly factor-like uncharacterized protein